MRTTLDLADPVLQEMKSLQKKQGGSLGQLASQLLADALAARSTAGTGAVAVRWASRPMGARVDLANKEALYRALDGR